MLEIYVKEFIAIVSYLKKHDDAYIKKDMLIVPKALVCELMAKNMYELTSSKLAVWRSLRWIHTDENRFTKKIRIGDETSRKIAIDIGAYEMLCKLMNVGAPGQ